MSDDLSGKTACVIDDGQCLELAVRLSKEFGRVYFHNPSLIEGFPKASKAAIGCGLEDEGVEWVRDLWTVKDKVDLFIFPDINNSGLQLELESHGKRVIGSRTGDVLENNRIGFKEVQKRLGMHVPKHVVIEGLWALAEHLRTVEDRWVKINRYRGSTETFHHSTYELSRGHLNALAVELGPLADGILFLVEDPIRSAVEIGYDGFCFKGQFPDKTLFGPEIKSKCYIGAATDYGDLDQRMREINDQFSPELAKHDYANFFSWEGRVAKDDENFEDGEIIIIEPTVRFPSPPFEAMLEMYTQIGAMLWHGSVGEVIPVETTDKYAVMCRLIHDDDADWWRALQLKPEVRQWVKLYDDCKVDDTYWIAPKPPHAHRIGAIVGIGPTIEDAVEHCREVREELKEQPVSSEFDSLVDALREIRHAEQQDIEFGKESVPQPEIVLE